MLGIKLFYLRGRGDHNWRRKTGKVPVVLVSLKNVEPGCLAGSVG